MFPSHAHHRSQPGTDGGKADGVCSLLSSVASFLQDRLLDRPRRLRHKDQCAERLSASAPTEVPYSDQAVLANLDWGIDALEEALSTSNPEAKLARLDHAERMLRVCAMLDPSLSTAGVPNSYLSAWAHLNLSFLHKLRGSAPLAASHVLLMFSVDPFFARIDFAPELWQSLFLPHMGSIVAWYSEARHRIVMDAVPDAADLSLSTVEFEEGFFSESLVESLPPDQAEKMRDLERAYGESLDSSTRMYAKYYSDLLESGSSTDSPRKKSSLAPIAEPPVTPLREVSTSIPDFVKFGPILPKSAGFGREGDGEERISSHSNNRSSVSSSSAHEKHIFMEDEVEDTDTYNVAESRSPAHNLVAANIMRSSSKTNKGSSPASSTSSSSRKKDRSPSFQSYSPADSPRTPPRAASPKQFSPKVPSPRPAGSPGRAEPDQLLRLFSNRFTSPLFSPGDYMETASQKSTPSTPTTTTTTTTATREHQQEPLQRFLSSHAIPILGSPRRRRSTHSADSDDEREVRRSQENGFAPAQSMKYASSNCHASTASFCTESEDGSGGRASVPPTEKASAVHGMRPPKDFVCPITGQLFVDPVTLETGQTFERRAIEEWLKRGNTSCPITRQLLSSAALPQTNYVLKRLIASWMDQNPELAQEFSCCGETPSPDSSVGDLVGEEEHPFEPPASSTKFDLPITQAGRARGDRRSKRFSRPPASGSPTSVISQAASEAVVNELKPHVSRLCTSEDLQECEAAVLAIARLWKESKGDHPGIHLHLSKPSVLDGLMELVSASVDREALVTSVYVLSELVSADAAVGETLSGSDLDCLVSLLANGLPEAVVLIYQLRPTFSQLSGYDIVPSLVQVIGRRGGGAGEFRLPVEPADAAVALLEHVVSGGDESGRAASVAAVVSSNGLPALIKCLNRMEEGRLPVVSVLLSCMRADRRCRHLVARRAELAPVLELFHAGDDCTRSICIDFISEIVRLNRRTFCNQILQLIKDEGAFSTMHSLLVYLQMAPMEQQPTVASLLLQLDLLVEPRKMSIYREEAIDAIIDALKRNDFPICQTIALETLSSLFGRLSVSGEPLIEGWLLKIAGVDQPHSAAVKEAEEEEDDAMSTWEKRVAFVLCNHDSGVIFKALEECLRSNSMETAKSCLVVATWLVHMLGHLPETGARVVASQCLLDQFVNVLQSSRNLEEKVLATLALKSFITDPDTLKELGTYAKRICRPLRKLKRCSPVVADTLKAIMNLPSVDPTEFWSCTELAEVDTSPNGEVLSLVHSKGRLFSSHSDGTIKVWDASKRGLRMIQEVHDHSKAVTSLYISSSGSKLYSGSLDKTIRVWTIEPEEIIGVQVLDTKESIQCLTASSELVCFASQGTGAKLGNWNGVSKHVNFNSKVKCLAMTEESLYCGCTGYNIQEIDFSKCTSSTLYSGTRKRLGHQTFHALRVQDGVLYAGGSSVDGVAGKAFSLSTKTAIGSFHTGIDIRCIALSSDFVFTGTKAGVIEVWLRERLTRLGFIKVGSGANTRITTLVSDSDGEMLFSGSSDGKIQVWTLD